MFNYTSADLNQLAIHFVGNKLRDEGVNLSKGKTTVEKSIKPILLSYFLSSFQSLEFYSFTHESELELNNMFHFITEIFENKSSFLDKSKNIAKHLYEHSNHPKVQGGELYVVYFSNCVIDTETVDVIGIFKSENKENFLKPDLNGNTYEIAADVGISTAKIDKGCLIFNTQKTTGYKISIIDHLSKSGEAQYWKNNFLKLAPIGDAYNHTENYLKLCKDFITKKLPEEFEITRTQQINLLSNSTDFFTENEHFDFKRFSKEVIQDPEIVKSFKNYKEEFETEKAVELSDDFDISTPAVKKQARAMKSILKLDNNFHVYVHGDSNLIERGYDNKLGKYYYKLFFDAEK